MTNYTIFHLVSVQNNEQKYIIKTGVECTNVLDMINMYPILYTVVVFLALSGALNSVQGIPIYEMSLVNLTYGVESDDVEFNMTINQKGLLSMNTFLHKESSDYFMQIAVMFDEGNGKFDNVYVNKTIDLCKFLSTPSYETLIQIYYKTVLKYENNLPTKCPIGGGTFYYIRNMEVSAISLPPYVPGSNAYFYVAFLLKEDTNKFKYLSGGKSFINLNKL